MQHARATRDGPVVLQRVLLWARPKGRPARAAGRPVRQSRQLMPLAALACAQGRELSRSEQATLKKERVATSVLPNRSLMMMMLIVMTMRMTTQAWQLWEQPRTCGIRDQSP